MSNPEKIVVTYTDGTEAVLGEKQHGETTVAGCAMSMPRPCVEPFPTAAERARIAQAKAIVLHMWRVHGTPASLSERSRDAFDVCRTLHQTQGPCECVCYE